jgi:hypothetical protein
MEGDATKFQNGLQYSYNSHWYRVSMMSYLINVPTGFNPFGHLDRHSLYAYFDRKLKIVPSHRIVQTWGVDAVMFTRNTSGAIPF